MTAFAVPAASLGRRARRTAFRDPAHDGMMSGDDPPRLPALQGRARERGLLDRLFKGANRGRSAIVVIRGEAGVGKTTRCACTSCAARSSSGWTQFLSTRGPQ